MEPRLKAPTDEKMGQLARVACAELSGPISEGLRPQYRVLDHLLVESLRGQEIREVCALMVAVAFSFGYAAGREAQVEDDRKELTRGRERRTDA